MAIQRDYFCVFEMIRTPRLVQLLALNTTVQMFSGLYFQVKYMKRRSTQSLYKAWWRPPISALFSISLSLIARSKELLVGLVSYLLNLFHRYIFVSVNFWGVVDFQTFNVKSKRNINVKYCLINLLSYQAKCEKLF